MTTVINICLSLIYQCFNAIPYFYTVCSKQKCGMNGQHNSIFAYWYYVKQIKVSVSSLFMCKKIAVKCILINVKNLDRFLTLFLI